MDKMTPEEKERFFAQYWGQSVRQHNGQAIDIVSDTNMSSRINNCHLLLTPLSMITDEHAIELGYKNKEMFHLDSSESELTTQEADRLRKHGYAVDYDGHTVDDMVSRGIFKLKEA